MRESMCNPGDYEGHLNPPDLTKGLGILQWTPATKLINWANANGLNPTDIDTQLQRIVYERDTGIAYYRSTEYPTPATFSEFLASTQTPDYLARAFVFNYERPADPYHSLNIRAQNAEDMYAYCLNDPPEFIPGDTITRRRMPLWMKYLAVSER